MRAFSFLSSIDCHLYTRCQYVLHKCQGYSRPACSAGLVVPGIDIPTYDVAGSFQCLLMSHDMIDHFLATCVVFRGCLSSSVVYLVAVVIFVFSVTLSKCKAWVNQYMLTVFPILCYMMQMTSGPTPIIPYGGSRQGRSFE